MLSLLEHFNNEGIISPRSALKHFGDIPLSEYVGALDSAGIEQNKLSEMTQEQIVFEHLEQRGALSQLGAAMLYDIWRLSATIKTLKKTLATKGTFEIHTELLQTKRDGHYAVYSLVDAKDDKEGQYALIR